MKKEMDKFDKNIKITQSNELNRAAQHLKLTEKRLMYLVISKINPTAPPADISYRINAKEYAEIYGIEPKNVYSEIKKSSDGLLKKQYTFWTSDKKGIIDNTYNWIAYRKYHRGEGWVEIGLSKWVVEHLQGLSANFSSYELSIASKYKSIHSWRIFELINMVKKGIQYKGELYITVDQFRHALDISEAYNTFRIKKQIIEPSFSEILSKSNIKLSMTEVKTGRKTTAFKFVFTQPKLINGNHDLFELFWDAYPKKIKRTQAIKVWEEINDVNLLKFIISSATRYCQKCTENKIEEKFIMQPSNWLIEKRWEDA